ncbi:MAG: response regulator [Planctomycetia bacterium]|nr:response regulator [Planctomycetia bacterium]
MHSLRIVVADDEPDMREYFQRMLPRLGHRVIAAVADGQELIEQCRGLQPDLVMTDIQMPGLDGIAAAAQVYRERPVPVILVSAHHDAAVVECAEADHVLGYLVKPIKQSDLGPIIAVAMRRFAQMQALQDALARVRQLQGLLPICTYCKKIRDDRNYWQQVETYITDHSAARFSHSICPDCYDHVVKPELEADLKAAPCPHPAPDAGDRG